MSLLIKNGEIVTGSERYVADIFCEDETISRIERNQGKEGVQFYTQQKVVTTRWFGDGVGDVWKK